MQSGESNPPRIGRADIVYTTMAAFFAVTLVLTNIIGTKLFDLFPDGGPAWINGGEPITLTAGIVTYPFTFFLTDVVSEIWGRRRADLMVVLGFVASLFMLAVIQVGVWLPPSELWAPPRGYEGLGAMQVAYGATFYNPRILLLASMTAYLVAQLLDVRLYHFWWRRTQGRAMWIRNNGSTMISQLADTIIVNSIFLRWGLGMEWETIGSIIVWVYICKMIMAWCDTPLIYLGCSTLRRFLGLAADAAPSSAPLA